MKKIKYLVSILLVAAFVFIIPNIAKATSETWKDTTQNIDWSYNVDNNGNIIYLKCETSSVSGTVKIPSKINDKTVISLDGGDYRNHTWTGAFTNCTGLTGVEIPNTIIEIGKDAFEGCTGLKNITIPDSVTVIENNAFKNCTGLKNITIPDSVTKIGDDAFYGCVGLTNITFSKNLSLIGSSAFYNCSGLTKVVLPNSVTTLGNYAFEKCNGLKEITLSENLTKINNRVFRECAGLTSIKLPKSVTSILGSVYDGAFYNCVNLKKILIPDTVSSIEKYAFRGCENLTIYGNDNSVAKKYAEDNNIKFDYISNWDKQSSGADVTAPTVEKIEVLHSSVVGYYNKGQYVVPANLKLIINVEFSEEIKGTIPTLVIKFGDGQNIELKDGAISGKNIKYVYTIKSTDLGIMSTVNLTGGTITDLAGNKAVLSCPKITVEYSFSSGAVVYANGTITKPDTSSSDDKQSSNDGQDSNSGSKSNGGSNTNNGSNSKTEGKQDSTAASGSLPYAGAGMILGISILGLLGLGMCAYLKYNKLKDVK